jgi:integrase/recombinase XerD
MTKLRQRMTGEMQLRGLAPATQRNYLLHVTRFARYFMRSPEESDLEDIREFHLHLLNERHLSAEAVNQSVSAIKFLYLKMVEQPWSDDHFPRAKRARKLPVVLSPEEVQAFFDHVPRMDFIGLRRNLFRPNIDGLRHILSLAHTHLLGDSCPGLDLLPPVQPPTLVP